MFQKEPFFFVIKQSLLNMILKTSTFGLFMTSQFFILFYFFLWFPQLFSISVAIYVYKLYDIIWNYKTVGSWLVGAAAAWVLNRH